MHQTRTRGWLTKIAAFAIQAVLVAVLGVTGGCVSVAYDCSDLSPTAQDARRASMSVAVTTFRDARPDSEKHAPPPPPLFGSPRIMKTCDSQFKHDDVGSGIGEALARHFNHVCLFGDTVFVNIPGGYTTNALAGLRASGHDAVLVGTVRHLEAIGHFARVDRSFFSSGGSLLGILLVPFMYLEKNVNEADVELADLKLIDTASGKELWSGAASNILYRLDRHPDPVAALRDTLKDVVGEIVEDILRASEKGWQ